MAAIRRSLELQVVLVGVFIASLYLLAGSSDLKHNGDTDLRYQTAQAIVDHHRLWIAQPMWTDSRLAVGIGHHLYAFYAPGQTLLMVPLYIAGKYLAHHLSLPYDVTTLYTSRSLDLFLGALLAVLFLLMATSMGYSRRTALVLTLVFGTATVAWPDAQSALEQTQVNLFLLLAVFALWSFVKRGSDNRFWLLLAGCAAGLAIFTRYDAAMFLPVLAAYPEVVRWLKKERAAIPRDWLVFAAGVVPWVILLLLWNVARFGSPLKTGLQEPTLGEPPWLGFLGLTISPGKGLIWYLPLVLLLPWAVPRLYRRNAPLCLLFAALVLLPILFYANVLYWHGDPAWGPRYLYVAVPYLVLPLGEIFQVWRDCSARVRLFALALIGVSLLLQIAAVSVTQWRFWYRLEATEERTSQPFRWGTKYYHYYWTPSLSPILIQLDDVYQITRLDALGDTRYHLSARPTVCHLPTRCVSNPADNYPVNTLAFWWADTRHPLLGPHTRAGIALLLAGTGALALILLLVQLRSGAEAAGSTAGEVPFMVYARERTADRAP